MAGDRRRSPMKGLTVRLPGAPPRPPAFRDDEPTDVDALPPTDVSNRAEPADEGKTTIEVVVVREEALPKKERGPWHAIEVWTKNRVYAMDASLLCVEVTDRATGKVDPNHPILGGRLGGGRKRTGRGATFTMPLPVPGTEAMFMRARKQAYTSAVERVLLRIRALRVRSTVTWEQVLDLPPDDDDDL